VWVFRGYLEFAVGVHNSQQPPSDLRRRVESESAGFVTWEVLDVVAVGIATALARAGYRGGSEPSAATTHGVDAGGRHRCPCYTSILAIHLLSFCVFFKRTVIDTYYFSAPLAYLADVPQSTRDFLEGSNQALSFFALLSSTKLASSWSSVPSSHSLRMLTLLLSSFVLGAVVFPLPSPRTDPTKVGLVSASIFALIFFANAKRVEERCHRDIFRFLWANFYTKYNHEDVMRRTSLSTTQKGLLTDTVRRWRRKRVQGTEGADPSNGAPLGPKGEGLFLSCISIKRTELEYEALAGKGSHGQVYVSRYRNRIVAVKEFRLDRISRQLVDIFFSEVRIMERLHHPNVIRLIGACVSDAPTSALCIVMEYARQGNLQDFLKSHRTSEWKPYKRGVAIGVAKGMWYLHSRTPAVLHLDLKTTNVVLNEWMEVKVTDFGAALYSTSFTKPDVIKAKGTKYYISPETMKGDNITTASDVYSFGSVLAEIGMGGSLKKLFKQRKGGPQNLTEHCAYISKGWTPTLPQAWKTSMPVIYKLIKACWSYKEKDRPTFHEITKRLIKWSGKLLTQRSLESPILRGISEFSTFELKKLNEGLSFMDMNYYLSTGEEGRKEKGALVAIGEDGGFDRVGGGGSGKEAGENHNAQTHVQKFKFPAWMVLDLINDWTAPEVISRGREKYEVSRSILEMENEHNKIVEVSFVFRIFNRNAEPRQLVMRMIWKELNKDLYMAYFESLGDMGGGKGDLHEYEGGESIELGETRSDSKFETGGDKGASRNKDKHGIGEEEDIEEGVRPRGAAGEERDGSVQPAVQMKGKFCYIIKGSEDGESCKVVFKSNVAEANPVGFAVDVFVNLFLTQKKKTGNLEIFQDILEERRRRNEMKMVDIEERANRYEHNIVIGKEEAEEERIVIDGDEDGFDESQPWVSRRALDRDYRQKRAATRVMC